MRGEREGGREKREMELREIKRGREERQKREGD